MDPTTIIRERNPIVRAALAPAAVIVATSFFGSVTVGICVTLAMVLGLVAFITHNKPTSENRRSIVLEVSSKGIAVRRRWVRQIEIPWQDV